MVLLLVKIRKSQKEGGGLLHYNPTFTRTVLIDLQTKWRVSGFSRNRFDGGRAEVTEHNVAKEKRALSRSHTLSNTLYIHGMLFLLVYHYHFA